MENKKEISKKRRRNAKLYPIYKMFSWDLLFFYSIEFLFYTIIGACIIIGAISSLWDNSTIIPIILLMYAVLKINTSIWYILEAKYIKNFTTEDMRNKITFTYEFIGGIAVSIFSILGGLLLNVVNVQSAFLIVGTISLVTMMLTLKYMKTRFGLKPEEYSKEDIEINV